MTITATPLAGGATPRTLRPWLGVAAPVVMLRPREGDRAGGPGWSKALAHVVRALAGQGGGWLAYVSGGGEQVRYVESAMVGLTRCRRVPAMGRRRQAVLLRPEGEGWAQVLVESIAAGGLLVMLLLEPDAVVDDGVTLTAGDVAHLAARARCAIVHQGGHPSALLAGADERTLTGAGLDWDPRPAPARRDRLRSWRRVATALVVAALLVAVAVVTRPAPRASPAAPRPDAQGERAPTGSVAGVGVESGAAPDGREGAGIAYDPVVGEIVLFGGGDLAPTATSGLFPATTWLWSSSGWWRVAGSRPDGRESPAMAFDRATGTVLLRGGIGADTRTWVWDGAVWTVLPGRSGPDADAIATMVDDAALGHAVLVSVCCDTTPPGHPFPTVQIWTWTGSAWRLAPSGREQPDVSAAPVVAYDARRNQVVLLAAGEAPRRADVDRVTADSTLWTWDGRGWTRQSGGVTPPFDPLGDHLAADPRSGDVVLFENRAGGGDTWVWNGATWSHAPDAGGPSFAAGMAAAPDSGGLLLFGGPQRDRDVAQVWTWTGTAWSTLGAR